MSGRKTVSIGPHFEKFVARQVKAGRFDNASEVVRAGLRLLEDHEQDMAKLRTKIDEGDAAHARGDYAIYKDGKQWSDAVVARKSPRRARSA
jgi:antitoxin ParD1/3/4